MRKGLFIGVDVYPTELGGLSSCVNDAVAMRDACLALGLVDAGEATLLTAPAQPGASEPTRSEILKWLLPLYDAAESIDGLIVYFSGHGLSLRLGRAADQLRTVLAPAGLQSLRNSGNDLIDLDELLGRFRRRGARHQLWIVDACRNTVEPRLDVSTIGWDLPQPDDPREALDAAWAAIFAVAPLARATADKGGHGRLTRHLLDGMVCEGDARWGASADYDEGTGGWLVGAESLVRYARWRVGDLLAVGDWRRDYELPQLRRGEAPLRPLRSIGALPNRPFKWNAVPADSKARMSVKISSRGSDLALWPPLLAGESFPLAPETYRLTATLVDLAGNPVTTVLGTAIDLRQIDQFDILIPAETDRKDIDTIGGMQHGDGLLDQGTGAQLSIAAAIAPQVQPAGPDLLSNASASAVVPQVRKRVLKGPLQRGAIVTVRTVDPACTLRLIRMSGGSERRDLLPLVATRLAPDIWRLEAYLGDELVSSSVHDFEVGGEYAISPRATVTPAIAALLADTPTPSEPSEALLAVVVDPTIGPMQGAILPTLLPLVALRLYDHRGALPPKLIHIPPDGRPGDDTVVALAFEEGWPLAERDALSRPPPSWKGARVAWSAENRRVVVFTGSTVQSGREIVLTWDGVATLRLPLLRAAGYRAFHALVLRPGRAPDSMTALVASDDDLATAAAAARGRAVLARLLATDDKPGRAAKTLRPEATAADPIFLALAWWHDRRGVASNDDPSAEHAGIVRFPSRFRDLPDARVIAALESPDPCAALDTLLDDADLGAPALACTVSALARRALASGRTRHWTVERFQNASDPVFNLMFDPHDVHEAP